MTDAQTIANHLAEYVVDESLADIPTEVIDHAKYCVLDSVGVLIGGTELEQGRTMTRFWETISGSGDATVATAGSAPAIHAVYINSYLANLLDYDDTYSGRAVGHPGATIVPSAIAVGEREDVDGERFIESAIAGYEVATRVGDAIQPSPEVERFVAGNGTWQIFGATAATSKLVGSDANTAADAIGIAGMSAPIPTRRKVGLLENDVQWMKNNLGWSSQGGVLAGLLADYGFHGNQSIFEGKNGFWRMAGSDRFDERHLRQIGTDYLLPEVSFKPYPSCRFSHATLSCVEEISGDVTVTRPEDVRNVRIDTFHEAANLDFVPDSTIEIPFSLPFVISLFLLGYEPGIEWQTKARLADEDVRALMRKVHIAADEDRSATYDESKRMTAAVTVELADGTTRAASVSTAPGSSQNPVSRSALEAKFDSLVEPVLGRDRAVDLRQRILDVENEPSLAEVGRLLGDRQGES